MTRVAKSSILAQFTSLLSLVSAHMYSVKISTDNYVNIVDSRFLSFTVDPSYLFASSEKYNSKECICMASALTPAFIRIAGPSTSHMTFHNATITFTDLDLNDSDHSVEKFDRSDSKSRKNHNKLQKLKGQTDPNDSEGHSDIKDSVEHKEFKERFKREIHSDFKDVKGHTDLALTHNQWSKFVKWAKATGFDLVFALNNEEKMDSGLWDPNSTLNILTMAEKAEVEDMYWQLGFECSNQTIEDYLNDLETLRLIIESFGVHGHAWRALGGDVTPCLNSESKSDFKDYVMLADDVMDALMLNGNSSAQELERMSDSERLKLLQHLSTSTTPLWLTESPNPQASSELLRAADWMTSLGYSARNGFAVHFRELVDDELYEPTLSFYMALLFKNLVGERVLDVSIEASQAVLFAHCTSLRHKPVPGAVTLFAANMDDEPARFSVKMSRREEGGDVMQFILGLDRSGNIVVNGRAMYYEGDIRPVVKRVRPYKTLLLNLPPKSFGFWVIANTKVEACHEISNETELIEALPITDKDIESLNTIKTKRSMVNKAKNDIDLSGYNEAVEMNGLKQRIDNLNEELENMHTVFETRAKNRRGTKSRTKRQIIDGENKSGVDKLRRLSLKYRTDKNSISDVPKNRFEPLRILLQSVHSRFNNTKLLIHDKARKISKNGKYNLKKRNSQMKKAKTVERPMIIEENETDVDHKLSRKRRAIISENHNITHKRKEQKNLEKLGSQEKLKKNHAHEETKKIKHHQLKKKLHNYDETSSENEIDIESDKANLWKILRQIHKQLEDLPIIENENVEYAETGEDSKDTDQIVVKAKLSDDTARVNFSEKSEHGLLKSTIENVLTVLTDLNNNLHRFWNVLCLLE